MLESQSEIRNCCVTFAHVANQGIKEIKIVIKGWQVENEQTKYKYINVNVLYKLFPRSRIKFNAEKKYCYHFLIRQDAFKISNKPFTLLFMYLLLYLNLFCHFNQINNFTGIY